MIKETFTRHELSGLELKDKMKKKIFYKLLRDELSYSHITYKIGLNKDRRQFKLDNYYIGLGFTTLECIFNNISNNTKIAIIEICDDSKVFVINPDEFITDKFIINEIIDLRIFINSSLEISKIAVGCDYEILRYIDNQTDDICRIGLNINGLAIEYIRNQTPELCHLAVTKDGMSIQFINKQTRILCELAVQQTCLAILYCEYKTKTMYNIIQKKNPFMIKYIVLE